MTIITPFRALRYALQDMFRNGWLTIATVSVLVLTILSINVLISVNVLGQIAVGVIQDKVDISVHFRPEVEDSRVQTVRIALMSLPEVVDVQQLTPADVMEDFLETNAGDEEVIRSLGEVGANPFGHVLVVKARALDGYDEILAVLAQPSFASLIEGQDFIDRQEIINRLDAVSTKAQVGGIVVTALFAFIALLIVWNTLRMSIYARRSELGIMRLVGASNWFIRSPFYVQAVIWSVLALVISLALLYPVLVLADPYLASFFGTSIDLPGFYRANWVKVIGGQLIIVSAVSIITTKMATSRYLKV